MFVAIVVSDWKEPIVGQESIEELKVVCDLPRLLDSNHDEARKPSRLKASIDLAEIGHDRSMNPSGIPKDCKWAVHKEGR